MRRVGRILSNPNFESFCFALVVLTIRFFGTARYDGNINDAVGTVGEENDAVVSKSFAVAAFPRVALQGLYVAAERILFKLAYAARDLPPLFLRKTIDKPVNVFAILTTQLVFNVTPVFESTFLDMFHPTAHFLCIGGRHNIVGINQSLWFHEYAIAELGEGDKIALPYSEFLKQFTGDDHLAALSDAPDAFLGWRGCFRCHTSDYLIVKECGTAGFPNPTKHSV